MTIIDIKGAEYCYENGVITSLTVRYITSDGEFSVDGDIIGDRLEVNGSLDYVRYCLREKLRKFENGQVKIINDYGERKLGEEEEIKRCLWEDVNVNTLPRGHGYYAIICTQPVYHCSIETPPRRPPSPCRIS